MLIFWICRTFKTGSQPMVWDDLGLAVHPRLASDFQALGPQPWTLILSLRHFLSTHYMKCSELSSSENCSCVFKNLYTLQSGIQRLPSSAEGQPCFWQHLEEGDRNRSHGKREKKVRTQKVLVWPHLNPSLILEQRPPTQGTGLAGKTEKMTVAQSCSSRAVSQEYPLTFFPKASKLFGLSGTAYPSLSLPPLIGHHSFSKSVLSMNFFTCPSGPFWRITFSSREAPRHRLLID